jgi:hypothetical protein
LLEKKFPASAGGAGSLSLEQVCAKKLTPDQRLALKKFSGVLMLLATVANPALGPVVEQYQELAAQVALGKTHGISAKLSDLNILRTKPFGANERDRRLHELVRSDAVANVQWPI